MKRQATQIIARLRSTRRPVVVTEHGRSAAVMVDIESWERLLHKLELLEGIARGERAFAEGRTVSHAKAKARLKKWLELGG